MTRQALVCRLTRYGRRRAWAALDSFSAHRGCSYGSDCQAPSTSYPLQPPAEECSAAAPGTSLHVRGFCSWPAAVSATAPAGVAASSAHTREAAVATHLILDPSAASEYDRRLREFLSGSRTLQPDLPPPPGRQSPAPSPSSPWPGAQLSSAHQQRQAPADAGADQQAGPASKTALPNGPETVGGAGSVGRAGVTSASASPSGSPARTDAAQPPGHAAAAAAAATRERARAALRDAPPFSPLRPGGGCSSRGEMASGGGGAAALPQPQPQPHPHPASPTPVDWREMLQRARQLLGSRAVTGPEMLTDKFRRTHTYLRISLTERCNLRCTYCMPDEGVALTPPQQLLTTQEIMRLARIFVEAGVTKIRLTGGEPTLRRDIGDLVRQLGSLRPAGLRGVAITSNGIVLARQLPALKEAGLTAINVSLDTLRPERFERLARRPGHRRVLESIRTAVELGYDPVKVNVVVMRGVNDDEVADFAALTRDQPINVRFIEYMPFDGNVWSDSKMVPYRELVSRIQSAFPDTPLERLDDPAGEVAKNFRLKGHRGSVSFITSMTQHFCSDCNRLRLLADGNLKVCLFGASEVSLRDAMRGGASDDDLRAIISAAVGRKRAAHAGMFELAASANRPMITIGG